MLVEMKQRVLSVLQEYNWKARVLRKSVPDRAVGRTPLTGALAETKTVLRIVPESQIGLGPYTCWSPGCSSIPSGKCGLTILLTYDNIYGYSLNFAKFSLAGPTSIAPASNVQVKVSCLQPIENGSR